MSDFERFLGISLVLLYFVYLCTAIDTTTRMETSDSLPETSTIHSSGTIVTSPKPDNFIPVVNAIVENKASTPKNDEASELVTLVDERQTNPFSTNPSTVTSTTIKPEVTTSLVLKQWQNWESKTKIFVKDAIKSLLPTLMEATGKFNASGSCSRDILRLLAGIRDIRTWAFNFIDASSKMIDGLQGGTLASLGDYDQCINSKAINERRGKNFGKVVFTGRYCSMDIKPPLPPKKNYYKINEVIDELKEFAQGGNIINDAAKAAQFFHFMSIRLGICVPSSCKISDIQQVVDSIAVEPGFSAKVRRCEVKEENEFTPLIISVMTVSSFFGFLLCVGSLIDLYHRYAQKKINDIFLDILVSFSLVKNFKKLVNVKDSKGKMSCLHGFRFLSISWIILGHTYLNGNYTILKSSRQALKFQEDFPFQAVLNANVAVDTFFYIGGFLVCYVTVTVIRDTGKPFNIALYILHRLFRLLPVYAIIISFIFLAPTMGSGPIWHESTDPFLDACYKNWWTNLLFVNNFINTEQICLPQSWYVSCDLQLYIAALLVLLPMLRWPRIGLSIAFIGMFASIIGNAAMTYSYSYPPTMLFIHPDPEQRLAYWANAYFKPYSHVGPYCIGLISGYILATNPKLKFSIITRITGWACAIACNLAVLYGVYEWNLGRDPKLIETLLYSGLHRVAWALGVAWIVVNCATGQGGVVNYILSWRVWVPLGRLTYTIYLIHPIVQVAILGNVRIRIQPNHYFIVWVYFGHLMITIGCSFVASMVVEAPFINLEKIVLRAITGKPKNNGNDHSPIQNDSTAPKTDNREPVDNGAIENGTVSHL